MKLNLSRTFRTKGKQLHFYQQNLFERIQLKQEVQCLVRGDAGDSTVCFRITGAFR